MIFLCNCQPVAEASLTWKDWFQLASPIVVLLLFIVDRIIGHNLRKKEIERNWYLKVLIEPAIPKISEFYKQTIESYKSSALLLNSNSTSPHNDYISLKSQEFGKFQLLKRELEAEVVFPIQMRYPKVGGELTTSLLNIEDEFTSSLDRQLFSETNIKDFQIKLANNRASFLTQLYSPLRLKSLFRK